LTAAESRLSWRFGAPATMGAAWGGGVRVSGGWIGEAQVLARMAVSPNWAVQADAGWLRGRDARFSSP